MGRTDLRSGRLGLVRKCEHGQLTTEVGVFLQPGITAHRTETRIGFGQTGGKADARPSTDAGQDRNILLPAMLIGGDVADDAGRSLELEKFLPIGRSTAFR